MTQSTIQDQARSSRHWQRAIALIGACLCTGTSASVYTFSLYGQPLAQKLNFNSRQTSIVAICANFGFLFAGPFIGRAADIYGPKRLAAIGAIIVCTAFLCIAYTYNGTLPWNSFIVLAFYETLMGLGSQCTSMAAVTTTSKNFKRSRSMAISLTNAFFGLSPLIMSQLNTLIFVSENGSPDTFGFIRFMGIAGGTAALLATLCLVVVGFGPSKFADESNPESSSTHSANSELDNQHYIQNSNVSENTPLVNRQSPSESSPWSATSSSTQVPQSAQVSRAQTTKSIRTNRDAGLDYDFVRDLGGMRFIRDPEAQLLSLVVLTGAGIGIFFINTIGTIVDSLYSSSVPERDPNKAQSLINFYVSLVSFASLTGRLIIGPVADIGKRLYNIPRSSLLVFITFGLVVSQIAIGLTTKIELLWIGTALTGVFYGSLFALVLSLTSTWFGNKHFGSNVGLLILTTPIGGEICGFIFGWVYDQNIPDRDPRKCVNGYCYRDAFVATTGLALTCLLLATILVRHRSIRRCSIRELLREEEEVQEEVWPL
ncbi:hypothetical protein H4219_001113 [Mycoemilia scoparia]|uniref:Major facilitator superfamily (MFS) profile domain-containing protein n=1 Tax=Mycoemilia scoparia TaxID=417184 RepID=A0A9W8A7E8_9FUNG|nr:hypothetical protein H4219_001113 [Mycoemilia scoparia]